jgi:2,3-bisphosphoglycerate-dependent phosphoglycerate mutase/probable phosphoglycerate mutase
MRRLVLLRHGQTDHNVAGRMQGHIDSVLTELGREQAASVAPIVAGLRPDRLISSDLSRAADTAELISGATGLPLKLDTRLRETHLGEWQGLTVAEVEEAWPGSIAHWRADPEWAPPGGESRLEVVRRSRPVVEELDDELAGDADTTVVLVAHGGLIAGLVCGLLALPTTSWPSIGGIGNCKWAALARRADHPRWRLAGYNVGV